MNIDISKASKDVFIRKEDEPEVKVLIHQGDIVYRNNPMESGYTLLTSQEYSEEFYDKAVNAGDYELARRYMSKLNHGMYGVTVPVIKVDLDEYENGGL